MDISIIIPTYKRPHDLKLSINLILNQSFLPKEIIVVDSANDLNTKNIVKEYSNNTQNVSIKYINNAIDSSSVARNIGAADASSNILLFLDDDAFLQQGYLEKINEAHCILDNALIVQGHIISETEKNNDKKKNIWTKLWQIYFRFFRLFHSTPNEMNVLKSGRTTTPNPSNIINCQWASGCNFSIKKETFEEYKFDKKLMKYSYGEDKDLSYRVYKDHPESVYLIPEAKLIHKGSANSSAPIKRAIIAEKTYSLYFIAKNMNKPINYICFIWSEIGYFLADLIYLFVFIRSHKKFFLSKIKYNVYAYYVCIKYFKYIQRQDLSPVNNRYVCNKT